MQTRKADRADTAIRRKAETSQIEHGLLLFRGALECFVKNLGAARFGALVVDYDGTVVDTSSRFTGPTQDVVGSIIRILDAGLLLGVATGRGKSVRGDLSRCLPTSLHERVWMGYYNGGVVARLSDLTRPEQTDSVDPSLSEAAAVLEATRVLPDSVKLTKRPWQITVEAEEELSKEFLWQLVRDLILKHCSQPVQVVASSHSVDVLAPGVSKRAVISAIADDLTPCHGKDVLCIGDRGCWPGNDWDLLSTPFSLSVDDVSADLDCCWNLASEELVGSNAFLEYLSWLELSPMNAHLRIPIET